ncbi:serine/threonine-protein kinase [Spirillospora sp. NPDC048911]|uniref:serine/threonine-protein kinase n=1 Tax=Spirillospora sp. NPDC048911 TaxID=3364527 RepID=UPI003711C6AC
MAILPLEPGDPRETGRYRLTGRLGEGGQGVVYLGEGPAGERVAVKMLKTTDAAARARFAREMAAARQVAPFCTAAVLDSSADGAHPYVVSEYVDGPSLQQRVAQHGPLLHGDLQRLAVNTASALAAIHGAGIVHRDLKPANVLLGPDGPRVVDFGIARAIDAETHTQLVGTPAYFAPEWLAGHAPTPASDVFAWAGTMVFAATGRPPFGKTTSIPAVMHRIANGEPDLTGVPPELAGLLVECLRKDPAARPSARDLMVRLVDPAGHSVQPQPPAQAAAPMPIPPPGAYAPETPTAPAGQSPRRSRRALLAAAGAGTVIVVLIGVIAYLLGNGGGDGGDDSRSGAGSKTSTSGTPKSESSSGNQSPSTSTSGSPAQTGGEAIPAAFAGTWKGTITQKGGITLEETSSTDVTVRLAAGKTEGTADYEAWGCHMTLKVAEASGGKLEVQETAKNSQGTQGFCIGGSLTLALASGSLKYTSGGGATGTSTGTLAKSG